MKPIRFTAHALEQCIERGASHAEVEQAIRTGTKERAKGGRFLYRANFQYNAKWQGVFYRIKQVVPVVAEQEAETVVITVYTFYF
jgi:hypothetical protein